MSKILCVQSSGLDTLERLYAEGILATTAKATDIDADIFFSII